MAHTRQQKGKRPARPIAAHLRTLVEELAAFADEFDASDPEGMQVMLDEHISNLIDAKVVPSKNASPDLEDVLQAVLGSQAMGLRESAQNVRQLIESYGDPPSYEDMEQAHSIICEILEELRRKLADAENVQGKLTEAENE